MARSFVPGTASSLRCRRSFLTSWPHVDLSEAAPRRRRASTRSAVSRLAFTPMRPTRQIGGAVGPSPPPTSMSCSRRIRPWISLPSTPSGTSIADSSQSWWSGSDRNVNPRSRIGRLEVPPGVLVTGPPVLQPFLEGEADALVQRVVLQDRHRVVVGDRAFHPVLLEQIHVEGVRRRVLLVASHLDARAATSRTGSAPVGTPATSASTSSRSRCPTPPARPPRHRAR